MGVSGSGYFGGDLSHNGFFKKNGVGSGGWISMTGTADISTPLDTSTATLTQIAERLKGIQDALSLLGILNASSLNPFLANEILFLKGDGVDNSTSIIDSSLNPKTVTVVGGAKISTTQFKLGGSSLYFDGSGDYLSVPLASLLTNFTVEAWCYLTSASQSTIWGGISNSDLEFAISTTQVLVATAGVAFNISLSVTTPMNTWNHFAFTRSSNILRIFKNGIKIHEVTLSSPFFNSTTSGYIGTARDFARQYTGYIDSFRITNTARYTVDFDPEIDTFLN